MKQNSKETRNPTDPVELPYCGGLEVISASQLQQNPVILTNDAGAASTSQPSREPQPSEPPPRCVHVFCQRAEHCIQVITFGRLMNDSDNFENFSKLLFLRYVSPFAITAMSKVECGNVLSMLCGGPPEASHSTFLVRAVGWIGAHSLGSSSRAQKGFLQRCTQTPTLLQTI